MSVPPPGCGKESGSERGCAGDIGEESQVNLRRGGARVDQHERGLPAVAGSDVSDGAAAGSDVRQRGNGGERVIRRREADPQHADLAAGGRIEFDGAAYIGRDRESQ